MKKQIVALGLLASTMVLTAYAPATQVKSLAQTQKNLTANQVRSQLLHWYNTMPNTSGIGLKKVLGRNVSTWARKLGMVGVSSNKPITANALSQWLWMWEEKARGLRWRDSIIVGLIQKAGNTGAGTYSKFVTKLVPMFPSDKAFTLLQEFHVWDHTSIVNAQSTITQADVTAIQQNLQDADHGYIRLSPLSVQLREPIISYLFSNEIGYMHGTGKSPLPAPKSQWLPALRTFDTITVSYHRKQGQFRVAIPPTESTFSITKQVTYVHGGEKITFVDSTAPETNIMASPSYVFNYHHGRLLVYSPQLQGSWSRVINQVLSNGN